MGLANAKGLGVALLLAVATLAAYLPVLDAGFVNYDDELYVTNRPEIRPGPTRESLIWAFTSRQGANWFPMTRVSWLVDARLHGLDARGFHATNLALHIAAALVLLLAFQRLTGSLTCSAFVAGVFALHPLHVESVAWISARKDVLSGLFFALTLLAYAWRVRHPSVGRSLLLFSCLALGLLAKSMLVTVPFVLLLLDGWPLGRLHADGRFDRRRVVRAVVEKIPLLVLVAVVGAAVYAAQQSGGAVRTLEDYPMSVRLENAVVACITYVTRAFWPVDLAAFYPHPGDSLTPGRVGGAAFALVAITAFCFAFARRRPELTVGWLWFLGMLVPVLGIVQVGQAAMADRYSYLPLIGLSVSVVYGLAALVRRHRFAARALGVAGVLTLGVLGWQAHLQARTWHDSRTLFEHALRVTERNHVAHINLGLAQERAGELDDASAHLVMATEIAPRSGPAHNLLGRVRHRQGRSAEALPVHRRAVALEPDTARFHADLAEALASTDDLDAAVASYRAALRLDPAPASTHANLGLALARMGRNDEAIESYRRALAVDSGLANVHGNLGMALALRGENEAARDQLTRALAIDPDLAPARARLALVLLELDRADEAVPHAAAAVRLAPESPEYRELAGQTLSASGRDADAALRYREALDRGLRTPSLLNNLAWILATSDEVRDPEEAVALATEASRLTGDRSADVLDTLATAWFAAGRTDEAVRTADRALGLAVANGDEVLAAEIRARRDAWTVSD